MLRVFLYNFFLFCCDDQNRDCTVEAYVPYVNLRYELFLFSMPCQTLDGVPNQPSVA